MAVDWLLVDLLVTAAAAILGGSLLIIRRRQFVGWLARRYERIGESARAPGITFATVIGIAVIGFGILAGILACSIRPEL